MPVTEAQDGDPATRSSPSSPSPGAAFPSGRGSSRAAPATTLKTERVPGEHEVGQGSAAAPLDVSVVVPVLDEQDTVLELARAVAAVLDEEGVRFEIVFVDDGSRDATSARIRAAHESDPRVKLLCLRRNFGKAAALSAGFEMTSGEIVITMDGDLQDDPAEIPRFLEMLEGDQYDLVSGWKQHRRDPLLGKKLPSRLFNWATRRLARVDLHDFNCGFKAYRRAVVDDVAVYGDLHRYIPVLASRQGFRVGELAVKHHARRHGVSKYGWDRAFKGPLDLITVLFLTRYTRRPLHLFGPVGVLSIAGGTLICLWLTWLWMHGEPLSRRPLLLLGVLMILLGLQLLSTGLIGEMITFKSFRRRDSYSVREWLD